MRLSRYFLPTLKEAPSDAQIVSHQLMLRAGMIKQEAAGIYARHYCGAREEGEWIIVGLDAAGIDLASGDRLKRLEFSRELDQAAELRGELARLLKEARAAG